MPITAILLIVTSACMHAWWNLRSKQSPSVAFFALALGANSIFLSPLLIYYYPTYLSFPLYLWILLALSGVFLTVYLVGLTEAYNRGDMSLIYPLLRAMPVIIVLNFNFLIGKGEQISVIGILGMVLIGISCFILPMQHFKDIRLSNYANVRSLFALLGALGTSGYTLIDDEGIRLMGELPNIDFGKTDSSILFWVLQSVSVMICMSLYTLFSSKERQSFKRLMKDSKSYTIRTGCIITIGYGLILCSMPYVSNVSYVIAFRQLSIPIGAVMGMFVLHEPRYIPKIVAIASIFTGLIMVSLG